MVRVGRVRVLRPCGSLHRQASGVPRVARPGAPPVLADACGGSGALAVGGDRTGALGPQLRGVSGASVGGVGRIGAVAFAVRVAVRVVVRVRIVIATRGVGPPARLDRRRAA